MGNERKAISKKIRFEVFKRDSFKCQYCGKASPDVVLVVDHIMPVKDGGDNEITNLITACEPCNQGKGARQLSDDTVIGKQRKQMEKLNDRREQLEMMMQWRNGLNNIEQEKVDAVAEYWEVQAEGHSLNETGIRALSKIIKKYGVEVTLEAIGRSIEQNSEYNNDGEITYDSIEKSFNMVNRIANIITVEKEKPYINDILYLRGILRNRLNIPKEVNKQTVKQRMLMGEALKLIEMVYIGYAQTLKYNHQHSIELIKDDILESNNYAEFEESMIVSADYAEFKSLENQGGCGKWQGQEISNPVYL